MTLPLRHIVTLGYEGAGIDDFLATLAALGVTTLLDVRELPMSRRKGFAKTALREGLARVGIGYRHERALGSPKAIRHQLRDDGDYARFFAAFRRHLDAQGALLDRLAHELAGTVALLCVERDPATCHRSVVADALGARMGLVPRHHDVATRDAPR